MHTHASSLTRNSRWRVCGHTGLHFAIAETRADVCRLLLKYGADVNIQSRGNDGSPLHKAAWAGKTTLVQLLLEHRADVDCVDRWRQTPLYDAAKNGHLDTVRALLKAGAAVDACDIELCTPLSRANENGHTAVVMALFEHGAG